MQRDSSPWAAAPGRRHDAGHTDEGDYVRRGEPGHEPASSGGQRSARGSNYGDWRGEPGHEPDPYGGGPGGQGFGAQDVPGRYQGGYRGGYGQGDQGAGGFQGSPQRSAHSGYPGMYEAPYAGAREQGSYEGPYTGQQRGRSHPKAPGYGRGEDAGPSRYGDSRQDSPQAGDSGEAWADRDWQRHPHEDPDYRQWREEQMRRLDEDYRLWRQDRYKKFTEDFDSWRSQRQQQQGGGGQTSVGSGPGEDRQVSGIAPERGSANGGASSGGAAAPDRDAATKSSGDSGTSSPGNTGNTTTGGHNAAVPGGGNDRGQGLGG